MAAMETQLYLEASAPGDFAGKDTEINGEGYAGMTFTARASSQGDFDAWVTAIKAGSVDSVFVQAALTPEIYNQLAAPSENNPVAYYSSVDGDSFNTAMMKFMMPMGSSSADMPQVTSSQEMSAMPGMQM